MEFSAYFKEKLESKPHAKKRYIDKLKQCQLPKDLYAYKRADFDMQPATIPNIRQCDLSCYMVHTPSQYTEEETKAWKAMLGADSFVQSGWVHEMGLIQYKPGGAKSPRFLVIGNVNHSQSMNATFLHPWIVAEQEGEIRAAHCDCMAGLGEACSHIAALITAVARAVHIRKKTGADACTSQLCAWLPPSKKCAPAEIKDIDFTSPSTKRRLEEIRSPPAKRKPPAVIQPPTDEEKNAFFSTLNQCKSKPGILRVLDNYADQFVPLYENPSYPKPLSSLYDSSKLKLGYLDLLTHCETVFDSIKVTENEVTHVEIATRTQSACKLWQYQRAGRVTASNFKSAARTDPSWPSESLIKRLCYPDSYSFSTEATRWGCKHEQFAIEAYIKVKQDYHPSLTVEPSGFIISQEFPFVGASPDGWLTCKYFCCGEDGIIEVKCPYSCKDGVNKENVPKNFCMKLVGDKWELDRNHSYYFQVQCQLYVTNKPFCDFILWTESGHIVQRIIRDDTFFLNHIDHVRHFYKYSVLPEIVGKWLSRKPISKEDGTVCNPIPEEEPATSTNQDNQDRLWCYCEQPSTDQLVSCRHKDCPIKQFHMGCLRLRCPPKKNSWLCPSCRKLPKFSRSKNK